MHGSSLNGVNVCNEKKALSHIHSYVISENAQWHFFIDLNRFQFEGRKTSADVRNK